MLGLRTYLLLSLMCLGNLALCEAGTAAAASAHAGEESTAIRWNVPIDVGAHPVLSSGVGFTVGVEESSLDTLDGLGAAPAPRIVAALQYKLVGDLDAAPFTCRVNDLYQLFCVSLT